MPYRISRLGLALFTVLDWPSLTYSLSPRRSFCQCKIQSKSMPSFHLLRYLIPVLLLFNANATEQQCHDDCRAVPTRLVGPTRPSDSIDALGTPIPRRRSYPYHEASAKDFDMPRFCELGCTFFFTSSGAGIPRSLLPSDKSNLDLCMERCDETYHYNVTVGKYFVFVVWPSGNYCTSFPANVTACRLQ